jgi:hypothetical protein
MLPSSPLSVSLFRKGGKVRDQSSIILDFGLLYVDQLFPKQVKDVLGKYTEISR